MVGSLLVPLYLLAHACLAAYMNILRRNPSTTCITSQMWHMTSQWWNQSAYGIADGGGF